MGELRHFLVEMLILKRTECLKKTGIIKAEDKGTFIGESGKQEESSEWLLDVFEIAEHVCVRRMRNVYFVYNWMHKNYKVMCIIPL